MNTCDTCKWWDSDNPDEYMDTKISEEIVFRTCRCLNDKFESDSHENAEASVIQIGMDAGYVALNTGPKFGCIHHEPK